VLDISYEIVRSWVLKFRPVIARRRLYDRPTERLTQDEVERIRL
jgi:hypothetical protein